MSRRDYVDRINERLQAQRDDKKDDPVRSLQRLIDRRQFAEDLRHVLRTPAGRRFVGALLFDVAGLNRRSFAGNSYGIYRQGAQEIVALEVVETLEGGDMELQRLWLEVQSERLDAIRAERTNQEAP